MLRATSCLTLSDPPFEANRGCARRTTPCQTRVGPLHAPMVTFCTSYCFTRCDQNTFHPTRAPRLEACRFTTYRHRFARAAPAPELLERSVMIQKIVCLVPPGSTCLQQRRSDERGARSPAKDRGRASPVNSKLTLFFKRGRTAR